MRNTMNNMETLALLKTVLETEPDSWKFDADRGVITAFYDDQCIFTDYWVDEDTTDGGNRWVWSHDWSQDPSKFTLVGYCRVCQV